MASPRIGLVYLCLCHLLLAVAVAGRLQPSLTAVAFAGRQQPSLTAVPVAERLQQPSLTDVDVAGRLKPSLTVAHSTPDCYRTVTQAPKLCAGEFIQAIFTGKGEFITEACCVELACVREWTCATMLRRFCLPPEAHQCDPSSSPAAVYT